MKIRLYLDEDSMSHALVHGLRARGVDVLIAYEATMVEKTDEEHLEFATAETRTLYSYNVGDFHELHTNWLSAGKFHAGIVLARQQVYPVGEQLRRLLKLVAQLTAEEMKDRLEFLSAWA